MDERAWPVWIQAGAAIVAIASGLIALTGLIVTGDAWNPVSSVASSTLALGLATSVAVERPGRHRFIILTAGLLVAALCWLIALG